MLASLGQPLRPLHRDLSDCPHVTPGPVLTVSPPAHQADVGLAQDDLTGRTVCGRRPRSEAAGVAVLQVVLGSVQQPHRDGELVAGRETAAVTPPTLTHQAGPRTLPDRGITVTGSYSLGKPSK